MIATYRLSEHLASFEFFLWLVMVRSAGASKIVFDISNPDKKSRKVGGIDQVLPRFYSIIEPGPALAGLKHRMGIDESTLNASAGQFVYWHRAGNKFERLKSVKPPVACDYTITLRNSTIAKSRDSNEDAWRRFGEDIGATVIDDYYVKPMHLHDRMALYAGAKMNFGVANGPIFLLSLTPYPVTEFMIPPSRSSTIADGIKPGCDLPWALPSQRLIWEDDTYDNLRRSFDKLRC